MAGPLELNWIGVWRIDEAVDGEVPGQRVRPFVAEHLDGLRLTKIAVEHDHEPLIPTKALAQYRFRQPGSPNDNGEGWRAFPAKPPQNRLKFAPAGAVHEGEGGSGTGVAAPTAGQDIQPDQSRRLLLMIRPARPSPAEVPCADLSFGDWGCAERTSADVRRALPTRGNPSRTNPP